MTQEQKELLEEVEGSLNTITSEGKLFDEVYVKEDLEEQVDHNKRVLDELNKLDYILITLGFNKTVIYSYTDFFDENKISFEHIYSISMLGKVLYINIKKFKLSIQTEIGSYTQHSLEKTYIDKFSSYLYYPEDYSINVTFKQLTEFSKGHWGVRPLHLIEDILWFNSNLQPRVTSSVIWYKITMLIRQYRNRLGYNLNNDFKFDFDIFSSSNQELITNVLMESSRKYGTEGNWINSEFQFALKSILNSKYIN